MPCIDLNSDIYYPPIPGLGTLKRSAVQRLITHAGRDVEVAPQDPEAEFRVWSKDKQGRDVVGPWIRPGSPISGRNVENKLDG